MTLRYTGMSQGGEESNRGKEGRNYIQQPTKKKKEGGERKGRRINEQEELKRNK